MYIYIILSA